MIWKSMASLFPGLILGIIFLTTAVAEDVNLPFFDIKAFCSAEEEPYQKKCQTREGLSFEKVRIIWSHQLPYIKWACVRDDASGSYTTIVKCLRWRSSKSWTAPPTDTAAAETR